MQDNSWSFESITSSKSFGRLSNSELYKLTEMIIEYISVFRVEQKRFTNTLFNLIDDLKSNTVCTMQKRLLSITDFYYKNLLKLEENPQLPLILGLDSRNIAESVQNTIKADISDRMGRLNNYIFHSEGRANNSLNLTFILKKISGDSISIEIIQSNPSNSTTSPELLLSVWENSTKIISCSSNTISDSCKNTACTDPFEMAVNYSIKLLERFKSDSLKEIKDSISLLNCI